MAHIDLPEGLPGIRGPMAFSPHTAKPMSELAEVLLRGENSLTPAEREMIAAHVSTRNDCFYCATSHAAIASQYLGDEQAVARRAPNPEGAPLSEKMKALLAVAGQVQEGGKSVREEHVARARTAGATDREIHDTVLIAAAFCMFNRYVDGLATWTPSDLDSYRERAAGIARNGYAGLPARLAPAQGGGRGRPHPEVDGRAQRDDRHAQRGLQRASGRAASSAAARRGPRRRRVSRARSGVRSRAAGGGSR